MMMMMVMMMPHIVLPHVIFCRHLIATNMQHEPHRMRPRLVLTLFIPVIRGVAGDVLGKATR